MRLPTDATLLIGEGADPRLEQVWQEESLPVLSLVADVDRLEADLEALGATTVVVCGIHGFEAAALTASLGYRTFLVGDSEAPNGARLSSVRDALEAGRGARARERWKAARVHAAD